MNNPFNPTLTTENYYEDVTYLSSSSLSNFVTFDNFGNPLYNFVNFLNPPRPDSNQILIGSAVDGELTEGVLIDDVYGPSLDKTELVELAKSY